MTSTQTRKPRETAAARAKREWAELMEAAVAAGYESPYPAAGVAPIGDIDDRCEGCGWTLFVSMPGAVYCVNSKCGLHRRDLRDDVVDNEEFCDECYAGTESSEHHEKCDPA